MFAPQHQACPDAVRAQLLPAPTAISMNAESAVTATGRLLRLTTPSPRYPVFSVS
jgi:hypothetical protein